MESNRLILLKIDLQAQMNHIERIHQKLLDRVVKLQENDEIILESIAYQIHNLFCATEDLLKIVASCFENNISSSNQWHTLLLQRMSQDIPSIRPALLSYNTHTILNSLRGFRHFFHHAYGATIEYEQLKINLDKALKLKDILDSDIQQFLLRLRNDND